MRNYKKNLLLCMVLLNFIYPTSNTVMAGETVELESGNFALGVGYAIVRFDTKVKIKDKQTGNSIFVDSEGSLGLPESDYFPVMYGAYQFTRKHMMGFAYFKVKRESTLLGFDETLDDVSIQGQVTLNDNTSFYNLFYGHTLYEDERSQVLGMIGINGLDLKYVLEANGTISYKNDPVLASSLTEDVGVFAPLPLFGFDFWHSFTPEWSLDTKVTFVVGEYQDVKAWVVNTTINARYRFNKHLGGTIGVTYFDADVTIEDSQERTDIAYGYDGFFLGLHVVF